MHGEINYFMYRLFILKNTWNYSVIVISKIEELRTASRFLYLFLKTGQLIKYIKQYIWEFDFLMKERQRQFMLGCRKWWIADSFSPICCQAVVAGVVTVDHYIAIIDAVVLVRYLCYLQVPTHCLIYTSCCTNVSQKYFWKFALFQNNAPVLFTYFIGYLFWIKNKHCNLKNKLSSTFQDQT